MRVCGCCGFVVIMIHEYSADVLKNGHSILPFDQTKCFGSLIEKHCSGTVTLNFPCTSVSSEALISFTDL